MGPLSCAVQSINVNGLIELYTYKNYCLVEHCSLKADLKHRSDVSVFTKTGLFQFNPFRA